MAAKAYNCSDTPLVLDDGSVLAGREHGEVDTDSDRVLDAVLAGTLVLSHDATHARALDRAAVRVAERAAATEPGPLSAEDIADLTGEPTPAATTVTTTATATTAAATDSPSTPNKGA